LIALDFHIKIADLKVTDVVAASGIFSGENWHTHWSAMNKHNTGLNLGKASLSTGCINIVFDSDVTSMSGKPATGITKAESK
jgi:hypothetical protein